MVLQTYGKEIISLFVPFIAWILNTLFRSKARLLIARPHAFIFLVQQPLLDQNGSQVSPTQTMHTSSFFLSNAGREVAEKVEVVFNWKPLCINLWPARHYEERIEPDGRFSMIFGSLSPREYIGIEMFSINKDVPVLIVARCDQCVAQFINMVPQPIVQAWKNRLAIFLVFAGVAISIYTLIVILQFLVLKTPYGH
jgi:hypothetical protein